MVQIAKEAQGIGWGNKTLKQLLEEKEKVYKDTGYYYGLKDLPLSKADPMKLELFHSRLAFGCYRRKRDYPHGECFSAGQRGS